jgi:hypothetical protein
MRAAFGTCHLLTVAGRYVRVQSRGPLTVDAAAAVIALVEGFQP